jgi:hypothetical protein
MRFSGKADAKSKTYRIHFVSECSGFPGPHRFCMPTARSMIGSAEHAAAAAPPAERIERLIARL